MRLMITDSGLGGMSVCAGLEHALSGRSVDLEILFVNANPHVDGGYNSLPTQRERIHMFDRFLSGAYELYKPDMIAIACNTLSVIYAETEFSRKEQVRVDGIVNAAVRMSSEHLLEYPQHGLAIFATETTVEAGTYPRLISAQTHPIISQACPDLASAITSDASGGASHELLSKYIPMALEQFEDRPENVAALLACTHYGYQQDIFTKILSEHGVRPWILDPNYLMVTELLEKVPKGRSGHEGLANFRFISRFPIPDHEAKSLSAYLKVEAPMTLQSLTHQEVEPGLFAPA